MIWRRSPENIVGSLGRPLSSNGQKRVFRLKERERVFYSFLDKQGVLFQDGGCDHWSWRAACQRSLLRRVASADAVTLCRPQTHLARRTVPNTTSHNSVYAWKGSCHSFFLFLKTRPFALVESKTISKLSSQARSVLDIVSEHFRNAEVTLSS